jgi:hypothetical protein
MPTVPQLPAAAAVSADNQLLLWQGGQTVSVTTEVLLASVQPQLTLSAGALLGRVAAGVGTPQAVPVGPGLVLNSAGIAVDTTAVAMLESPALAGRPTAPTQLAGDNSDALATTAFVSNSSPPLTFVGDVTGSGTSPITLLLPPISAPGVYSKVTVNGKGQVTAGGSIGAADVIAALGYTPASSTTSTVLAGADASAAVVYATGATTPRSLASVAADRITPLSFGADPTGNADCAPAFAAAMSEGAATGVFRLFVPRGTYLLNSAVNQPAGRSITIELDEGAVLTGPGYLGVDRVESHQGPYRISQVSGGFFFQSSAVGAITNPGFDTQIIGNTPQNSGAARAGWMRNYTNSNLYSKYSGGEDFAEQNVYSWPSLLDGTAGFGHWDVVAGATYDEATAAQAGLSASCEQSQHDVVNNGPESGWSYAPGIGNPVQGISVDPWGQNGAYGGHLLYAYGSVGSFDGTNGGLNQRWISYPAVYGTPNGPAVPQGSSLTITMDVTAKGTAIVGTAGTVTGVTITQSGGAYTGAPTVTFTGGGGSGAAATAILLGGFVVGVAITNPGANYSSAPVVSFSGGGAPAAAPVTVALNGDGAHGDPASVAAAIRAAAIPMVDAAVARWGGVVASLVIFGTAPGDVGTLTLSGSALPALGIAAQPYTTDRQDTALAIGGPGPVAETDQLMVNGTTVTVGGAGALSDVVAAINRATLPGIHADVASSGNLVLTAWTVQQPCGLVLSEPAGCTTLQKLRLVSGTTLPPTPPKAFATAYGEMGAGACKVTDAISVAATDLAGNSYGPLSVTLNGGGATGSVADVAASLKAALATAGWGSAAIATLTSAPQIVSVLVHGSGAASGLLIRNTAGGTLTISNAAGQPLDTLGVAAGTYQPGGYSAGSQTVFHVAPNALAPQGRGVFIGGSSVPDATVWPHAPAEFRGNFSHGLRTDKASFGDNNALLLGAGQAIGWGLGGATLTAAGGQIAASVPASLPGLSLTALPTTALGLPAGTVWNNGGVLSIV